jgi:hypothetical protein
MRRLFVSAAARAPYLRGMSVRTRRAQFHAAAAARGRARLDEDNPLRHVPQRRVEQPARRRAAPAAQSFGEVAEQNGERYHCKKVEPKNGGRAPMKNSGSDGEHRRHE